jgi:hypothetical protein
MTTTRFQEFPMRIAYWSLDEVNQDYALDLAQTYGVTLCPVSPRDEPLDGRFDAVLFDLDSSLSHGSRALDPENLPISSGRLAVHSYSLATAQEQTLRQRGIAVFERLGPEVFEALVKGDQMLSSHCA